MVRRYKLSALSFSVALGASMALMAASQAAQQMDLQSTPIEQNSLFTVTSAVGEFEQTVAVSAEPGGSGCVSCTFVIPGLEFGIELQNGADTIISFANPTNMVVFGFELPMLDINDDRDLIGSYLYNSGETLVEMQFVEWRSGEGNLVPPMEYELSAVSTGDYLDVNFLDVAWVNQNFEPVSMGTHLYSSVPMVTLVGGADFKQAIRYPKLLANNAPMVSWTSLDLESGSFTN